MNSFSRLVVVLLALAIILAAIASADAGCFRHRRKAACQAYGFAYRQQAVQYRAAPVPAAVPIVGTMGSAADFLGWINGVRGQYGLPAVGYDPNLESWAAMNSAQQASSGIGHFVMGPARRQNSAMGGFPGIESMWMASPAHRAALLDPTIRWIGIASYGAYWTFDAY
jgi:uncharacterized protein YkwD